VNAIPNATAACICHTILLKPGSRYAEAGWTSEKTVIKKQERFSISCEHQ